jgi:uncharacterized damage-inducible protein DinB
VHGVVIMLLLRVRQESTSSFRLLVHAAEHATRHLGQALTTAIVITGSDR